MFLGVVAGWMIMLIRFVLQSRLGQMDLDYILLLCY